MNAQASYQRIALPFSPPTRNGLSQHTVTRMPMSAEETILKLSRRLRNTMENMRGVCAHALLMREAARVAMKPLYDRDVDRDDVVDLDLIQSCAKHAHGATMTLLNRLDTLMKSENESAGIHIVAIEARALEGTLAEATALVEKAEKRAGRMDFRFGFSVRLDVAGIHAREITQALRSCLHS